MKVIIKLFYCLVASVIFVVSTFPQIVAACSNIHDHGNSFVSASIPKSQDNNFNDKYHVILLENVSTRNDEDFWVKILPALVGTVIGGFLSVYGGYFVWKNERERIRQTKKLEIQAELTAALANLHYKTGNIEYIYTIKERDNFFVDAREEFKKSIHKNIMYLNVRLLGSTSAHSISDVEMDWYLKIIELFDDALTKRYSYVMGVERKTGKMGDEKISECAVKKASNFIEQTINQIKKSEIKINL